MLMGESDGLRPEAVVGDLFPLPSFIGNIMPMKSIAPLFMLFSSHVLQANLVETHVAMLVFGDMEVRSYEISVIVIH